MADARMRNRENAAISKVLVIVSGIMIVSCMPLHERHYKLM
jgi:hypothetical protein